MEAFFRHGRLPTGDNFFGVGVAVETVSARLRLDVLNALREDWLAQDGFELALAHRDSAEPYWLMKSVDVASETQVFLVSASPEDANSSVKQVLVEFKGPLTTPFAGYFEAQWMRTSEHRSPARMNDILDDWELELELELETSGSEL